MVENWPFYASLLSLTISGKKIATVFLVEKGWGAYKPKSKPKTKALGDFEGGSLKIVKLAFDTKLSLFSDSN